MKKIIIIIGPSGSGKSVLEMELANLYGFRKAISHTTREMRDDETDGVDYHFVTRCEFEERTDLVEKAEYNFNYYGLTEKALLGGDQNSVIVVEPHGAAAILKYCNNLVKENNLFIYTVFMAVPPSNCHENMVKRGDRSFNVIDRIKNESIPLEFIKLGLTANLCVTLLDERTTGFVYSSFEMGVAMGNKRT